MSNFDMGQAADILGGGGGQPEQADQVRDRVVQDLQTLISDGTTDDLDTQVYAKCLAAIQGLKANVQKQQEAAMGTTPAHKAIARSVGAAGGY